MLDTFFTYLLTMFSQMGYAGIITLMAIESSFIPFPSEVVIPPAAYLAQKGDMNLALVVASGVIGSLIGAIFNYAVAYYLGRKIIYGLADHRIARMMLINSKKIEQSEKFFLKYSAVSTFIGRLVPAVRQLISLPAGFSRMKLGPFLFYTTLGSSTWVIILAILGYSFGANQELLSRYYREISWVFLGAGLIAAVWLFGKYIRKSRVRD